MESLVYAEPASLGIDPEKFKEAEAVLKKKLKRDLLQVLLPWCSTKTRSPTTMLSERRP